MRNWHRNYFFESTGLKWIPPSAKTCATLKGSLLYPGLEILQNAGVSVGRGTEAPFEEFGAPWIIGGEIGGRSTQRIFPRPLRGINRSFRQRPVCRPAFAAASACGLPTRSLASMRVG